MRKAIVLLGFIVMSLFIINTHPCFAGLIDYDRLNKIKAKKQSAATPKKTQAAEDTRPAWLKGEPKVTSKIEQEYDINRDEKLQSAEVKVFLRDVLDQIDEKGGYTINSDILKEYDKNRDGVVSRYEAEAIRKQVR